MVSTASGLQLSICSKFLKCYFVFQMFVICMRIPGTWIARSLLCIVFRLKYFKV